MDSQNPVRTIHAFYEGRGDYRLNEGLAENILLTAATVLGKHVGPIAFRLQGVTIGIDDNPLRADRVRFGTDQDAHKLLLTRRHILTPYEARGDTYHITGANHWQLKKLGRSVLTSRIIVSVLSNQFDYAAARTIKTTTDALARSFGLESCATQTCFMMPAAIANASQDIDVNFLVGNPFCDDCTSALTSST